MQNLLNKIDIAIADTRAIIAEETKIFDLLSSKSKRSHYQLLGELERLRWIRSELANKLTIYVVTAETFDHKDRPDGRSIIEVFVSKTDADAMCESINSGEFQQIGGEAHEGARVETHTLTFPTI